MGAFGSGSVEPTTGEGARLLALPIALGAPLKEFRDDVRQSGALARAKQLTAALDVPTSPPSSTRLLLIAGVSMPTMSAVQIQPDRRFKVVTHGLGDSVVLRQSALMDEREEKKLGNRLTSPIWWTQVLFIFSDHLDMTKDPAFANNILYFLLESPRMGSSDPELNTSSANYSVRPMENTPSGT